MALDGEWKKTKDQDVLPVKVGIYRSPVDGWPREECKVFSLGVVAPAKTVENIQHIQVVRHYDVDVEALPDLIWSRSGIERCPPERRTVAFDIAAHFL